jgi:hypothetical protein
MQFYNLHNFTIDLSKDNNSRVVDVFRAVMKNREAIIAVLEEETKRMRVRAAAAIDRMVDTAGKPRPAKP